MRHHQDVEVVGIVEDPGRQAPAARPASGPPGAQDEPTGPLRPGEVDEGPRQVVLGVLVQGAPRRLDEAAGVRQVDASVSRAAAHASFVNIR